MMVVLLMVSVLMLPVLESSMAPSPPENLRPALDFRPMRPMALQMVRQHLLSLTDSRNNQAPARLLQDQSLPDWLPDRDECYIEYCNHYKALRESLCCAAGGFGGLYCCSVADSRHVQRCKSEAIHQDHAHIPLKRHIFSPSCGGVSQANSTVHHNGTHFVREVQATWKCVFPEGTCFDNHAPLEGLPDKMQDCITEENKGPLTVNFVIDLHCANMDQKIHCDSSLNTQPFDPFHTCTNDPNMLKATCHLGCTNGYPKEFCTFEFDSIGAFNMSDRTIDTCSLHAECMSPYVEANSMFCSTHQGQSHFKPHWESRPLPNRENANHGIRGPPLPNLKTEISRGRLFSLVLWLVAVLACGVAVLFLALRAGALPEAWQDQIEGAMMYFNSPSARSFGTPYRAPSVRPQSTQYVAPAPASTHADQGTDQELEKIVGDALEEI